MSERQKAACERAHGPYKHGNRWRVVVIGADGKPVGCGPDGAGGPRSFESEEKAREFKAKYNAGVEARTIEDAVNAYLEHAKVENEHTNEVTRYRLVGLLRLPEQSNRLLRSYTAGVAKELYAKRCQEVAVATHHSELRYANRAFTYFAAQGWLKFNPFAEVVAHGKVNRGKPQLRVDSSRTFVSWLLGNDSMEATAVLLSLLHGLRATEVVERLVGDLDNNGTWLWITKSKTVNGEGVVELSEVLWPRMARLAEGREGNARLFGDMTRYALHYHTAKFCKLAGVPRVTPHGLRGTQLTEAVRRGGGTGLAGVAAGGGHGDNGATLRRHYLGAGAEESARGRALETLLVGKKPENPFPTEKKEDLN